MATTSKVFFRYGTRAAYDALVTKDSKSLYFLLDTNELYRGDIPIGISHYYEGVIDPTLDTAANIASALGANTPVVNDLLVLVDDERGTQDLFVYASDDAWHQLNAYTKSESIIFSDGSTLDEKLATVQASFNINGAALELDNGVLSLKDYQKRYYKYVAETEAQGEEGDPEYVPAVPAHYELVTVDEQHPWPSGLTPKVNADGSLGWYEPNTSTLEGLRDLVDDLQTQVQNLDSLEQRVGSLETTVGTIGTEPELDPVSGDILVPGTDSTGLIARVENLEEALAGLSGAGIHEVRVANNPLVEIETGVVNIDAFAGTTAPGVVPGLSAVLAAELPADKKHYYLNANGQWDDSVGDLTFNSQTYDTVAEYVDARIEDSTLKWEEIS